ncbi:Zinc finger protein-like, C3H1 type-like 3 [Orchesella cincta]|uniref:Zinc finger protein-like, C3H1 type-like 3 n=1 Tax=Orchesella cincta TaxID=48709 RepID=A0A1D2N749_ORCCI|nr:Zinc finger protein-like, C3H1 type-like 3 [Orchesella cincta]
MNSRMNPARIDREDERRMLPCRNFLDGFCPKGSRCRFYHPAPSAIPTVIRVPNLPSSFQQNNHGQFPGNSGQHPVFPLSPSPSSRTRLGINSKLGMATPNRFHGMNGLTNNYNRGMSTPVSPTYSEYEMAYAQQMEIKKEKERRAAAPPAVETEENLQNTVFSHIDWKEFLAPGVRPPPPTHVPYMSNSPGKPTTDALDSLECLIRQGGNTKAVSPPPLTKPNILAEKLAPMVDPLSESAMDKLPSPKIREYPAQMKSARALSAKEELQMKVKQIAKELASEPAQHVQSLDTFFRNYTFQAIPSSAPSSEQDLVGSTVQEAKEVPSETTVNTDDLSNDLPNTKSETITIMTNKAFSSDSGISSAVCSGDSASSSMESMKADPQQCNFSMNSMKENI